MLAIDEEKLPPPTPAVAAQSIRIQNWVSCDWVASQPLGTRNASSRDGISSKVALMVVHTRPPNFGTANVYGMRSAEPTRFGTAVSQNISDRVMVSPAFARLITTTDHSTHSANPRCSAKIEKMRFLRAIFLPVDSQNCSSSVCQSSIQRPPRRATAFGVSVAVSVVAVIPG